MLSGIFRPYSRQMVPATLAMCEFNGVIERVERTASIRAICFYVSDVN